MLRNIVAQVISEASKLSFKRLLKGPEFKVGTMDLNHFTVKNSICINTVVVVNNITNDQASEARSAMSCL